MENFIINNHAFNQIETWLTGFKKEVLKEIEEMKNLQNDDEIYYTAEQTAEILCISIKTLYNLNNAHEITFSKASGKCFYTKKSIKEYLERNTYKSKYEIEAETFSNLIRYQNAKGVF
ncbi:helix-turn-helix domain-containing protein [Empedobacter falsenii]